MALLRTKRQTCTASHVIGTVVLRCGLLHHGGGMHCDTRPGIALWWMAAES